MSFPPDPLSNGTPPITATCSAPECGRPTVVSAVVCRVHLTDGLREQGEVISWDDPELAGVFAVAIHILRVAMDGIPQEAFGREPRTEMDMYALLDPSADWAAAQVSLDVLGTHIADQFGAMALSPPTEFRSKVLLRLRVIGPGTEDELRPRLSFAMESMIREVVGPDVEMTVAVEPPDDES